MSNHARLVKGMMVELGRVEPRNYMVESAWIRPPRSFRIKICKVLSPLVILLAYSQKRIAVGSEKIEDYAFWIRAALPRE